jgi:hypothetical protein
VQHRFFYFTLQHFLGFWDGTVIMRFRHVQEQNLQALRESVNSTLSHSLILV